MTQASFLSELKRRNVIRVAIAYVAVSWLALQAGALIFQMLELPGGVLKGLFALLAIGFIPTMVFSWVYELTPEGLKRESEIDRDESITHLTGRKLDYIVIGVLAAVVALLLVDKFVLAPRLAARAEKGSEPLTEQVATAQASVKGSEPFSVPEIAKDPSIAVLPMVNMSDDKANEFFSDGISEELLNLLAKVPELRVIARTSSFSFKGKDTPIPEIAKVLHVASVLEGSVRKSGDKVRITVQLIRATDGSHLWSETYDRTLDDIFKVQDEIAAAVVQQLQLKLLGNAPKSIPVDPKAYPLLLQAKALSDQGNRAAREQALALLEEALAIAPNAARAWAIKGRIYFNQANYGERPMAEGSRLAKEAVAKVLALDPSLAEAHAQLARIAMDFELDLPAAARQLQQAFALDPGDLRAVNTAGLLLANLDRMDQAVPLFEYRVAHDPASATTHFNHGIVLSEAGRWDEALEALRRALKLSPEMAQARGQIGLVLLLGKHDAAGALKETEAEPDELVRMVGMPLALHASGRDQEADAAFRLLVDKYGAEQPYYVACVEAYRGHHDAAFEWIEKAVALRDSGLSQILVDPLFDSLHDDPRWVPFLRRIGYAPEQVAQIQLEVKLPR